MQTICCPDAGTWQEVLKDDVGEFAEWSAHLETCDRCRETLESVAADAGAWNKAARLLRETDSTPSPDAPALTRAMQQLLAIDSEERGAAIEDEQLLSFLCPADRSDLLGTLGRYEVRHIIGRGGMGVVLEAFDPMLNRTVAIKVMTPHLADSSTARKRFLREVRAAAALAHDHIIPIYEVADSGGLPYMVMQYVDGISLQARLDRDGSLPLVDILRIGLQTASALAAAHAQGVIHRDVKPANILLENGVERVKITDFGLARNVEEASITQSGIIAGTPLFMSPEQARGEVVGPPSDLFSLGSVLYALCAGQAPFQAESTLAVLCRVSEDTPRSLRSVNPNVPDWLEEIVVKLLAKKPGDRFESAAEVASLLGQHLANVQQPDRFPSPRRLGAVACPSPVRSRRRYLLAALVLLATLGTAAAIGFSGLFQPGDGQDPDQPVKPVTLRPGTLKTPRSIWFGHVEGIACGAFSRDGKTIVTGSWDGSVKIWDLADGKERVSIPGLSRTLRTLAISPDSETVATAGRDFVIRLWNTGSGKPGKTLHGHVGRVLGLAFSPDGKMLASGGGEFRRAGELKLCNVQTGKESVRVPPFARELWHLAYAPDGKSVAAAVGDGTVQTVDTASGKVLATFKHPFYARRVAYAPNGKSLAVTYGDGGFVQIWNLEAKKSLTSFQAHSKPLFGLAYSPDGKTLATVSGDGTVILWDVTRPQVRAVTTIVTQQGQVWFAAFSPDGRTLATGGDDKTVRLWEVAAP